MNGFANERMPSLFFLSIFVQKGSPGAKGEGGSWRNEAEAIYWIVFIDLNSEPVFPVSNLI